MNAPAGVMPMRPRRPDRLAPPRRGGRGAWAEGGVSAALHALVLVLLMVSIRAEPANDVTQPGAVAVMFEGGQRKATPQTEESRQSSPTSAPNPTARGDRSILGATAPALPHRAEKPSPRTVPALPVPPSQAQPAAPAEAEAPRVPTVPGGVLPPALPRLARRGAAERRAVPRDFATLSHPLSAYSLMGNAPPPASAGHLKRGIDLAMAPNDQNSSIMTRYAEARHKLGEDWWDAFTQYVEAHKYYPMSAAERDEDGRCVLRLTIARDGTVLAVKLLVSTGSSRLDAAWISEFRGAHVPPFPPGTVENQITFPASMDYILLRG